MDAVSLQGVWTVFPAGVQGPTEPPYTPPTPAAKVTARTRGGRSGGGMGGGGLPTGLREGRITRIPEGVVGALHEVVLARSKKRPHPENDLVRVRERKEKAFERLEGAVRRRDLAALRRENEELSASVVSLTREMDALRRKTVSPSVVDALAAKLGEIAELKRTVSAYSEAVERLSRELVAKDGEIASLKEEISALGRAKAERESPFSLAFRASLPFACASAGLLVGTRLALPVEWRLARTAGYAASAAAGAIAIYRFASALGPEELGRLVASARRLFGP